MIIPYRKNNRKPDKKMDKGLYHYRHLVENLFARIKHYSAIATRYGKFARNYASTLALAFVICHYLVTHVGGINDEYKMSTRPNETVYTGS